MRTTVAQHLDRPSLTGPQLRGLAYRLAATRGLCEQVPVRPRERTWARLDAGPRAVAWLIRWPAGTGTGWHDHLGEFGPVSGAFLVLEGSLLESAWTNDGPVRRVLGAGRLRSFGPGYVHDVRALEAPTTAETEAGGAVAVEAVAALSVHVYSPALVSMRSYQPRGNELLLTGVGPLDEW